MTQFCRFTLICATLLLAASMFAQAPAPVPGAGIITSFVPLQLHGHAHAHVLPRALGSVSGHTRQGLPFADSLANFSGHYFANGVDSLGNPQSKWYWNAVGNPPEMGGTTFINAPIIPVSLDIRLVDGSPAFFRGHRVFCDVTPFVQPVLNSPVFQNADYSSSPVPTQYVDAVQRAEFAKQAKPDWHTILVPSVKTTRVITVTLDKATVFVHLDGSCAVVLADADTVVPKIFPPALADTSTAVGAAELAGEMTTKDITTVLLPNTVLFEPDGSFFTGFHFYDIEPGDDTNGNLEKRYVANLSSWIDDGIFFEPDGTPVADLDDVSTLTHELAETFNDPFIGADGVHNLTPWHLSPNGICQDVLEVGDAAAFLPHSIFPMVMNGFLYHLPSMAMRQWFEQEVPSSALHGAYSYPNENVLTAPPPPNLPVNCGQ